MPPELETAEAEKNEEEEGKLEKPPPLKEPPLPPPAEAPPDLEPNWIEEKKKAIVEVEESVRKQMQLDLFELVLDTARVEDLGPEQQAHYRKVEASNLGVCSRCRWTYGCLSCEVGKAWRYVVKWELGMKRPRCAKG